MVSSLQPASHQAALPFLTFDLMEMTANLLPLTGLTLGIKDTITLRYAGQAICNSIRRAASIHAYSCRGVILLVFGSISTFNSLRGA